MHAMLENGSKDDVVGNISVALDKDCSAIHLVSSCPLS
jgi:hypothetical protein